MSEIFPNEYAVYFVAQIVTLMSAYVILRFKARLKVLTTLCLSVLVIAGLTLLLLCLNNSFIIRMNPVDLEEYVDGPPKEQISVALRWPCLNC